MKLRFTRQITIAAAACVISTAFAQEMQVPGEPRPMFAVKVGTPPAPKAGAPAATLPTWQGAFTYQGRKYTYTMVGTSPKTGSTTTITAVIVPIKFVVTSRGKQYSFDPNATILPNGNSVTQNTVASPIFDSTTTYVQGGVNVGTTQYVDAFQRGNFWAVVQNQPNYHVLLAPQVVAEQTITVPANFGTVANDFGVNAANVDYDYTDNQLLALVSKLGITADQFPIFLGVNTYLTSGGCCIGGYHFGNGQQTYTYATYVTKPGAFAQDVSALSHEVSEWMDDPIVNGHENPVACGILEVGDPLEGEANYGGYPYVVNGFTYNLQDEVFLPYFGAPPATSVNSQFTFQGQRIGVCSNGG